MAKITKNEQENLVKNYTKKPAYSNSRLSVPIWDTPQPKMSFDAMTIVGNLNTENAKKLSEFMSIEPQIRLWDILQTKFKAKALQEKVYIEYDKVKADSWDRRNMRVEFNPNRLTHEEMLWLKQNIIDYMEDDGFTRLDLAFDFEDDLSDYYAMSDKSVKKAVFYGTNGMPETKYFGVRDSDRFIRIYNKKKERKDNADIEIDAEHLWRVEIELKRSMVDYWNDCFNDLHILKPDYSIIEKAPDRHTIMALLFDESEWGKLERKKKYRMRKLMTEISPIDLTELMKLTLKENEKQLQKQIDFWQREFRFWK
ncbi:replication initiation factor domain-containing protein [Mammaliicoccus sciuri]|uniref:replication initiation factor domain-containing protein n=1 Tax=Staphylococcaceae TaxID=90964 RepID=UPI001D7735FE|nr:MULTISPECIES: replication initiation factor domain-containing protein [Staphylococcaceae]MDT0712251.1 replication initiation factor domain-containing protein [Mammaliicoccus sciuri]HJG66533.1 replication initiation factor domain-containing protein [Staphylococcus ureilyticus]